MQLIDPAAFAGADAFATQMDFLVEQSHANPPLDPARPVRLPGEQACRNIANALRDGVPLSPGTAAALAGAANHLGVDAAVLG